MNITRQILAAHLVSGTMTAGEEIALHVDQTLTQDALGMLCYIALESLGIERVKTELSVSYVDHNLVYMDYKNPDDHTYLRTIAQKYGLVLSRAGNGICHLVHLGRFSKPGKILIGNDSHTPSAGAAGMLGIGVGGIDVAAAMAGFPLRLSMPKVVRVRLTGALQAGVSAKDAALYLVGQIGVAGGKGKVLEYAGEGLKKLTVPQRMTLANMGAETGATSSVFPSDDVLQAYLTANGRGADYVPLYASDDAQYDEEIECCLSDIRPMTALPHLPDHVCPIDEADKVAVDQVYIGSCTNSSYSDLRRAALVLKGHVAAPNVSLVVSPGTRQIYRMLIEDGSMDIFVQSGARILECGCGPCVGMGQSVRTGGVSVRTSNRNFKGRCGTVDSSVYLTSTESAAACAVLGRLACADEVIDPAILAQVHEPDVYEQDDAMLLFPPEDGRGTEIVRGPNIRPMPVFDALADDMQSDVVIKLGDHVSTDEIAPAGPQYVSLRANIPEASKSTFIRCMPDFAERARRCVNPVIVAGENYGQGSSREHAAVMPRYLGVRAVIAKSIARIHRSNLINFGILPLTFEQQADYDAIREGDELAFARLYDALQSGKVVLCNRTTGRNISLRLDITPHEAELLRHGGLLNAIRCAQK